jgi:hypothetical protein
MPYDLSVHVQVYDTNGNGVDGSVTVYKNGQAIGTGLTGRQSGDTGWLTGSIYFTIPQSGDGPLQTDVFHASVTVQGVTSLVYLRKTGDTSYEGTGVVQLPELLPPPNVEPVCLHCPMHCQTINQ